MLFYSTNEELIKTLRRTLIILIKSQEKVESEEEKDDTFSMQLLNKIVRMIEVTTDDIVMVRAEDPRAVL